ncbi:uncharacterized protein PHALS_07060 [Plasmopara halstedii]|uniref:Uncharacterized protein n=1 Tax=Plasmopara halstedii TaxID=4781 RepID=A0A0P1B4N5_PLAHL|nr:uncharacterized protein PHALS_07060 [Plasmopara halstedii]CEG49289.1 hypothetical protein PHALS_07060 [Plasmopara halstedii]|eukprot:XP_024585658.1 hypothetical protein PHALS_07060 [Plasmopara halstedii]
MGCFSSLAQHGEQKATYFMRNGVGTLEFVMRIWIIEMNTLTSKAYGSLKNTLASLKSDRAAWTSVVLICEARLWYKFKICPVASATG